MKAKIVYISKYGATEDYMKNLGKELNIPLVKINEIKKSDLEDIDVIIVAGSIRVSKLNVLKKIKKYQHIIKEKTSYLFACGLDKDLEKGLRSLEANNLDLADYNFNEVYYLPGRFDVNKMSGLHKFLFSFLAKALKKKTDRTEDETAFLESIENGADYIDMEYLKPLKMKLKG